MDDDNEKKKAKGTKKVVMKGGHTFENYKDCLFNGKTILKKQQRFNSDYHKVYTEEVSKTALTAKMIRDWMELQHILTEQMLLKWVKAR